MMLIAALGVVGFGGGFLGGPTVATAVLYAWALCWAVVSSVAATFSLSDSLRNLSRFRLRGYTRPRFWFEVARSACILGAILALASFLFAIVGVPDSALSADLLLPAIIFFIFAFFVASTVGYLQLLVSRHRALGRATQCVGFFYPFCLAGITITAFVYLTRGLLTDPLIALVALVAICLVGALALTLINRWNRDSLASAENV